MLLTGSLAAISNLSYFFDVFCRSFVVRNSFEMEQCIINRLLITPAFLFTIYGFFKLEFSEILSPLKTLTYTIKEA